MVAQVLLLLLLVLLLLLLLPLLWLFRLTVPLLSCPSLPCATGGEETTLRGQASDGHFWGLAGPLKVQEKCPSTAAACA